jgi:hypothetical protein
MLYRITILTVTALFLQLAMVTSTSADLITVTDAEQQVGAGIGYFSNGTDYKVIDEFIPDPPQGPGDADLNVSLTQYGVPVSGSLVSVFEEYRFTANGSSTASSEWGDGPSGSQATHGGSGSVFVLRFTSISSPAYLHVKGEVQAKMDGSTNLYPEETSAYVKLSSDDEGILTKLWEVALDGTDAENTLPVDQGLWLEAGTKYVLEASAGSGTIAEPDHPGPNSRSAKFSLTATIDESEDSNRYYLKDYLPLEEGITWNYLQTYADGHKNYEVQCIGGTQLIDDIVTHKMWEFDSGELEDCDYWYECIAWTKEGLTEYKSVSSDGSYNISDPPLIWFPASIRLGETFKHSCEITEYDKYDRVVATWPYSIELTLERVEDIEVLAGNFTQCLRFFGTEVDEGQEAEIIYWLAPGVGEVKRAFPDDEERELIYFTNRGKTYYPAD